MNREQTLRSALKFLLVGGTTVAVDGLTYTGLLHVGLEADVAKTLSFALGAVFAYFANWRFTFGARRSRWSEALFVVVYTLALLLNVGVNAGLRSWLGTGGAAATIAFLVATGASAVWNFVGMSLFVFGRKETAREHATA